MPSSYPVPSCAVPVSGGMVVAVPLELLASPLKNGRPLGGGNRSALVIGGTEKVRTGGTVVFCKVVAVAEAQVKRDGQVRAKGSPVHHATLGPLEERLESGAGPGVIGRIAAGALGTPYIRHPSHGGLAEFREGLLRFAPGGRSVRPLFV